MNKLTDVTSIIISIFSVGALLAGLVLNGQNGIRNEIRSHISGIEGDVTGIKGDVTGIKGEITGIKEDIADLQQRMARIEGQLALLIEAWNVDMPPAPVVADS